MQTITGDRTANGLAFRVMGHGPPLVLVHGLLVSGAMFDPLVPLLDRDFTLIVPDLRGHGASRAMPGPYAVEHSALDVVELLDHLGLTAAHLLGYSHGGPICQQVARDHPARVDRLVLACTYAYNTATTRERIEGWVLAGLISTLGPRLVAQLILPEGKSLGGGPPLSSERVNWLRGVMGSNPRRPMIEAVGSMRRFDSRAWLPAITVRTLVVAGAQDHAVPKHHFQMLTRGIPKVESRIIEGAGHSLVWTHTRVLADTVRDWLHEG